VSHVNTRALLPGGDVKHIKTNKPRHIMAAWLHCRRCRMHLLHAAAAA
jgi:hypothetical protein